MAVYGEKTPPNVKEENWNQTRAYAYGLMASAIYQKKEKDYPQAQQLYEKVVKFNPKRDDAHYYIAMCKWQNKDPEGAIESFAKAIVLKGATAANAQKYVEQLYKPRHNNTMDGFDQVLQKAKTDLGL
jgi:tetratricopeptide (TPR) repeat protein